jgi:hypothetical protein
MPDDTRTTLDVESLGRNANEASPDWVLTRGTDAYADWAASGGGGGALPDWWTVDSTLGAEKVTLSGRVVVTAPGHDKTVVIVGDANSANDALVITDSDNPNSIAFGVDPFGYMAALGADLGSASGLVTLKVHGAVDQDAAQFFSRAGHSSLRALDHNNAAVFRVDDDGSVHIKTGTTIQADL